jgi:hypothetical protein
MIKLLAILKYQNQTFTHGIAPISYAWNVSNPNILSISTPQITGSKEVALATSAQSFRSNPIPQSVQLISKKIRDNAA